MSERRIVVPEGMLDAFMDALLESIPDAENRKSRQRESWRNELAAALKWLSENPIVPTDDQTWELIDATPRGFTLSEFAATWQRRMFISPEPAIPNEIKDLLWEDDEYSSKDKQVNDRLIEAFHRGQRSAK